MYYVCKKISFYTAPSRNRQVDEIFDLQWRRRRIIEIEPSEKGNCGTTIINLLVYTMFFDTTPPHRNKTIKVWPDCQHKEHLFLLYFQHHQTGEKT